MVPRLSVTIGFLAAEVEPGPGPGPTTELILILGTVLIYLGCGFRSFEILGISSTNLEVDFVEIIFGSSVLYLNDFLNSSLFLVGNPFYSST